MTKRILGIIHTVLCLGLNKLLLIPAVRKYLWILIPLLMLNEALGVYRVYLIYQSGVLP